MTKSSSADLTQIRFSSGFPSRPAPGLAAERLLRPCANASLLSAAIVLLATPRFWAASTTPFQLGDQGGVIVPVMVNGNRPVSHAHRHRRHPLCDHRGGCERRERQGGSAQQGHHAGRRYRANHCRHRSAGCWTGGCRDNVLPSIVHRATFDSEGRFRGLSARTSWRGCDTRSISGTRSSSGTNRVRRAEAARLRLAFEHGRFLVSLPQDQTDAPSRARQRRRRARAVQRSAAECLSPRGIRADGRAFNRTGHAMARHVRVRELRVGDRTMRDVPAVSIERVRPHPAEGDGLLPLHLFERVTFDGPARVLILG